MGQKVNPIAFRTGIMIGWKSRWYASKQEFADLLIEDQKIRDFVKNRKDKFGKQLYPAIAKIEIERTRDEVKVILFSARPGHPDRPQGRARRGVAERAAGEDRAADQHQDRGDSIGPELVAQLVAEDIAEQLIKRAGFRRDDEAGDRTDDGGGRQGDQDPAFRPAGRRGNVAPREADRRLHPPVDPAGEDRLRLLPRRRSPRGTSAFRFGSIKARIARTTAMALMPKRVKHRKSQRGRIRGDASRGNRVVFGDFGLQSVQGGWVSAQTFEAGRIAAQQYLRTEGRLVHPRLPAQTDYLDSLGNPHGQGQGRAGVLGGGGEAGDGVVRDWRRFRRGGADVFRPLGPQDAGEGAVPPPTAVVGRRL